MGYFKDLHTNSDGSCITCGTQQLSYDGYNGCLCSIIDDVMVAADERIIKLLEAKCYCHVATKYGKECIAHDYIALIKGEK